MSLFGLTVAVVMSVTELEKRNDFGVPSVQTLLDLLPLCVRDNF